MARHPVFVLVFATAMEAAPLLQRLNARTERLLPFAVYRAQCGANDKLLILITGMGLQAARQAMHYMMTHYAPTHIVNLGIAGSLSRDCALGDIVQVTETGVVRAGDDAIRITWTTLSAHADKAPVRLLSVNEPVFDNTQKQKLAPYAQLVDMEGAAIAAFCQQHALSCRIFKIVSDDAENRQLLLNNLTRLSGQLAAYFHLRITHFLSPKVFT
ncbi:MAG: hypothetical protein CVV13_11985 [Gammaproteobacteria bacterium HGW-Gammaproteobacteria-3]|nr:MAG: hypothetical protein CVV13_11985 [Gammaproteobacteria bacterium HGW-Gammaproteobacteria-3]